MDLKQNINVSLQQKLTLSHEMLQSLEMIQLPILDLKEKINQEVLENPALEILNEGKYEDHQNIDRLESSFNVNEREKYFEDSSSATVSNIGEKSNVDTKRQFLEGAISRSETLHDILFWQLHLLDLPEREREIGETMIQLIDENGFFKEDLEKLFEKDLDKAADVLELIQTFDPPGVGSANIQEALLFQIESLPKDKIDPVAYEIVTNYFDLMVQRKDSQITKNMNIKIEEVKTALSFIGQFEPYPGRVYDSSRVDYITPDAYVYKNKDELIVEINDEVIPSLTISKYMQKIAAEVKNKKRLDKQKKYVSDKVYQAKRFIQIIRHRNESLFRLVLALSESQRDFFFNGPKHLRPLTMKQIADEIGLAESTISRLAASKYIQTEWGIHEIRYFFTNAITASGESNGKSAESVREIIKEIIEVNDGKKISDQKISDILAERGIKIARRTVTKYRKMLNILPSHQRNI
ncbi:MAG: RNA polymerase factor sigma-54 [Spirochaetes bacterium]|nr:RNA polymerase factor sigma-54 [Spirochaetota bacterium]